MKGLLKLIVPNFHERIVEDEVKRKGNVIYGARAMNKQLPVKALGRSIYARPTRDYDIYSMKPRAHAMSLERKLDNTIGHDGYYTKSGKHKGTHKVIDKGLDNRKGTPDDKGIADFTRPARKVSTVTIGGLKYASLSERVKDIRASLKRPEDTFRHEKDKADLWRIRTARNHGRIYG